MITVFGLATAAGAALAAFERWSKWPVIVCGIVLLAEGAAFPLPINGNWSSDPRAYTAAPGRAFPERDVPDVYKFLRTLDNDDVVVHLPFGLPEREIQYVYYSAIHGRRIVNGYSGAFPPSYTLRMGPYTSAAVDPRAANEHFHHDSVTVVVVHTDAWVTDAGKSLVAIFDRSNGYERVGRFGDAYVYRLHYQ
jgi:hypothetical protein